jgi:hypothetical protein
LAILGAAGWAVSSLSWLILYALTPGSPATFGLFLGISGLLSGLFTFTCFVWLACRRGELMRWRLAYGVLAATLAVSWVLSIVIAFSWGSRGEVSIFMIPQAASFVIQFFALALAMFGDLRASEERHWSHWFGAGMRLLAIAAAAALYAAYIIAPPAPLSR